MSAQAKQKISLKAILLSLVVLVANIFMNGLIFWFFRDSTLNPLLTAILAVIWGVAGVYLIYYSLSWAAEQFPDYIRKYALPYVFIGPAVIILGWLLILPALRTLYLSFFNASSEEFVGLGNYAAIFSDHLLATALRNNLLWVFIGTFACVAFGLLIAILADRSSYEKIAKSIIFMPMAISFVAAGVIWKFVYYYQPGDQQIGLLNAIVVFFGGEPQAWVSMLQPWNNFFLIVILIWMQTGFAMVIFSAAIKGVPEDILEAARRWSQ
ncbi:carbohydrate ABC transporter permease [Paenibacillus pini]|uniref:ABC alpha-glucoside transporter n=1 Tax=Paenibacillus pini JCM 16418 TaxID=1236976 RepID=W7YVJ2_9BACL|nr:sugar ABC transporter permease [Paenibacillus pini]GAF06434.1 ABC alpha-glucoside transporter [Paenibacillus pini JCM 16418]